jgi:hypothetical protein
MLNSNVHIDDFVQNLASIGVSSEDIESYLYISQQFEMTVDIVEKMDHLENLFTHFQSRYPQLYELMEEEMSIVVYRNFH